MSAIISLIGMMGSGKSMTGRSLARLLGFRYIDLDTVIEETAQLDISKIFSQKGEAGFRDIETSALKAVLSDYSAGIVLSCGGGVILRKENRDMLKARCFVVWLDVPIPELIRRLLEERSNRPLIAAGDLQSRIRQLSAQRDQLYDETAHFKLIWHEGMKADDCAKLIYNQWTAQAEYGNDRD